MWDDKPPRWIGVVSIDRLIPEGGSAVRKRDSVDEAPDPWQATEALERELFEIRKVIAGQDVMLERVIVCLLTGGHLLIEGVPGLATTLTVKATAPALGRVLQRAHAN